MSEPRYSVSGLRDYTGAALEDIVADLRQLHDETIALLPRLKGFEEAVAKNSERLDAPDSIKEVIRYHSSLFEDYARDLKRLVDELPQKVEDRHIRIVENLENGAGSNCWGKIREFKKDHITASLKDEELKALLEEIYISIFIHLDSITRTCILKDQLRTYIGTQPEKPLPDDSPQSPSKPAQARFEPLTVPPETKWEDIFIRFRGEEEIEIHAGRKSLGVQTFARCGFSDLRTKKPNKLWYILRYFASEAGVLSTKDIKSTDRDKMKNLKKGVSLLRHHLNKLFPIEGNAISGYSNLTKSWKTIFRVDTAIIGKDEGPSIREDIADLLKEEQEASKELINEAFEEDVSGKFKEDDYN